MRTARIAVWLTWSVVATSRAIAADPLVVNLWPGAPPGDTGIAGEETTRIFDSPIVGPTRLITNVSHPTLSVFRPDVSINTGTAMIVCPGGGYWDLFWELEGEEVGAWLTSQGITAIVLKYRCPRRAGETKTEPPLGPQLDAQRAVRLVRDRAKEWGIDAARIGIVGFSAGGHLALATATKFSQRLYARLDAVDDLSCRPDFAIARYPGYLQIDGSESIRPDLRIPPDTPPIFLAHASDDSPARHGSDAENSVLMYVALKRAGVSAELHVFATGDHDFGVRQNARLPSSWPKLCLRWLSSKDLLAPAARGQRK